VEYWRRALDHRRALLRMVGDGLAKNPRPGKTTKILASLRGSWLALDGQRAGTHLEVKTGTCAQHGIQPETLVGWVTAWRADRARWRAFLTGLRPPVNPLPIQDAPSRLAQLGIRKRQVYVRPGVPATDQVEPEGAQVTGESEHGLSSHPR
jgi:hypothetical protein